MVGDVIQFFEHLAEDPDALAQFQANPAAAMEAANLPEDARQAILSLDPKQIRAYLAVELQKISATHGLPPFQFMVFCVICSPNPGS